MDYLREESNKWCLYLLLVAIVAFVAGFCVKFCFGVISDNITKGCRMLLYEAILSKQVGWFDETDHAAGILSTVLANEAAQINGAGVEAFEAMFNAGAAMAIGLLIAFWYSWRIALVCFGCVPFMIGAAAVEMSAQFARDKDSDPLMASANKLAGDAIMNYRTLASFGNIKTFISEYDSQVAKPI
jgi:ABC-type multidrug transport system fused ATPase/permease subunit